MHAAPTMSHCPLCNASDTVFAMDVRDAAVSGEVFQLADCKHCGLRFTHHPPCETSIVRYYQSDEYISHQQHAKDAVSKLYMLARKFTLQQKRRLIERFSATSKGSLLDIGAGTGAFLHTMQMAGWDVTGLEPADTARDAAQQQFQLSLHPSAHLFELPDARFDIITMWHVLEHVHDLHGYLSKIRRLLKPQGKLFIAVPNVESQDALHYGAGWAAYDVPRHLYHFSPDSMRCLMERNALKVTAILPMWLDAFYIALKSEEYRKGSRLSALVEGCRSNLHALFGKKYTSSLIYVVESTKEVQP